MPVTSCAFLEMKESRISSEFLDRIDKILDSQDAAISDCPSTISVTRGAAFFQQIEDPTIVLATSQWPSTTSYWEWRKGAAAGGVISDVGEFVHNGGMPKIFMFADGLLFGEAGDGNPSSLLEAQHISFSRWMIPSAKRDQFLKKFEHQQRQHLSLSPINSIRGSWRSLDDQDQEAEGQKCCEFITVVGCDLPREVKLPEKNDLGHGFLEATLKPMTISIECKHYVRIM